jgi:hypothetical protein
MAAQLAAARIWRRLDPQRLTQSWDSGLARDLFLLVTAAQLNAATGADDYVAAALALQGVDDDPEGPFIPASLAGIASDGRSLSSLLYQALVGTRANMAQGVLTREAMDVGERQLQRMIDTQVADAGRIGDGTAGISRRKVRQYVRILMPPSCARCALLAGVVYSAERAFQRHPRCDCIHMPIGTPEAAKGLLFNVKDYFLNLSTAEQNRIFTNAGAQAIRDGADINQIVNARRGMSTAGGFLSRREGPELFGRNDLTVTHRGRVTSGDFTREGIARGFAKRAMERVGVNRRIMPETIYRLASDREEILRLLRRYGYIS